MIKAFALILFTIIDGQVYIAPVTYYDTQQACLENKALLMQPYRQKNVDVRALCAKLVPE